MVLPFIKHENEPKPPFTNRRTFIMMAWSQMLREQSLGWSLLMKSGMLGVGLAAVWWVGWPQPSSHNDDAPGPSEVHHTIAKSKSSISTTLTRTETALQSSTADIEEVKLVVKPTTLVDLNLGSRRDLERLPGIGKILAERIVAYRSAHGVFEQVTDLEKVSGIGKKRLHRLEAYVTVQQNVGEENS